MKISSYRNVEALKAEEGSEKLKVRWLITKDMGAENFAMRHFEMDSGGFSPLHSHPWEHEVFVLEGEGLATNGKEASEFKEGAFVFVPSGETHQLRNTGRKTLKFICVIPYKHTP